MIETLTVDAKDRVYLEIVNKASINGCDDLLVKISTADADRGVAVKYRGIAVAYVALDDAGAPLAGHISTAAVILNAVHEYETMRGVVDAVEAARRRVVGS